MKSVITFVLMAVVIVPLITGAKTLSPCTSTAETAGGVLMVCPAGDGPTLADIGATILVTIYDSAEQPVPGIPAADFWIVGGLYDNLLCGGYQSCSADANTNSQGQTTISGAVAAGGYSGPGSYVVAMGYVLRQPEWCGNSDPMPLVMVSPDVNNDGAINNVDLGLFGAVYPSPSGGYPEFDFNGDGMLTNIDFTIFANHYQHACQ